MTQYSTGRADQGLSSFAPGTEQPLRDSAPRTDPDKHGQNDIYMTPLWLNLVEARKQKKDIAKPIYLNP